MQHSFAQVPQANIPRSSFNRSFGHKTTFDSGYLIPIFHDEALPGDTFSVRMTAFARLATPIVPVMDNIFLDTFFFAVPIRLIWDNWQKFNGEQRNPDDSTDYLVPIMGEDAANGGYLNGSLHDYLGLPTEVYQTGAGTSPMEAISLWHRAYNLIWNEWFRDQTLQDSVVVDVDDGPDDPDDYVLLKRGKRHDYFTSCLPWPQKGTAVSVPIGTSAPVMWDPAVQDKWIPYQAGTGSTAGTGDVQIGVFSPGPSFGLGSSAGHGIYLRPPDGGLVADLSDATAATINQLRQAFQLQRLYERDARGGTRYTEIIRSHFGVVSPDARMQRPEFLGGGTSPVNIHPIAQTSSTDATTPQGNLAAIGTSSFAGHGFTKSFTEHCVVLGLICARTDLTYQAGLHRMFSRRTRWDFYWPALAQIGEQAVLNKEIVFTGTTVDDENVFGYQERYAEYRYKPSMITGRFRSNYSGGSLDIWHLSQNFGGTAPGLDAGFISENPPIDRIMAVPGEPQFLLDTYFKFKAVRPMPVYGVHGMIDHF